MLSSQTERVYRLQARPALTGPGLRLTDICHTVVCRLMVATLVIHVINLPTPEGWKAELS